MKFVTEISKETVEKRMEMTQKQLATNVKMKSLSGDHDKTPLKVQHSYTGISKILFKEQDSNCNSKSTIQIPNTTPRCYDWTVRFLNS